MERVTRCNAAGVNGAADYVLYWMISYRRLSFNFALERAIFWASELRKPLMIFEPLSSTYHWASARFHEFVIDGMRDNLAAATAAPVTYVPYVEGSSDEGRRVFARIASSACIIITDDFPAFEIPHWIDRAASRSRVLIEKVDSNGLFPMRATERLFLTAASFRRFLEKQNRPRLPGARPFARVDLPRLKQPRLHTNFTSHLPTVDQRVAKVAGLKGGTTAARARLREFVQSEAESSGLSPYLHFGHISAQEVYDTVRTSRRAASEHFLDELVTWRELGFNMCALSPDYDQYRSLPQWARNTLAKHASDPRPILYSLDQLENAETHDAVWNAAQAQLLSEGRIENRLRMLWGKKFIEWSATPQESLDIMIHLNNKYAVDGRDPNSYTGIFWTLGRYDRPWGPERPIFGVVRYMSSANTARKLRKKSS